jgi:hypothetical protein
MSFERRYGRFMNYPRRLRQTVDYWADTYAGSGRDELAVNFSARKDVPEDVVMVVIALEAHQTCVSQTREIRNTIAVLSRRCAVGPTVVPAGTWTARSL